jgi:hypothetical protein
LPGAFGDGSIAARDPLAVILFVAGLPPRALIRRTGCERLEPE